MAFKVFGYQCIVENAFSDVPRWLDIMIVHHHNNYKCILQEYMYHIKDLIHLYIVENAFNDVHRQKVFKKNGFADSLDACFFFQI